MTGYPDEWEEIAHRVKEEAGWRCEECRHPDSYETGYVLTVHHSDGDKTNCSRENLKALCQRCHLKRQGRLRLYGPEDQRQLRLALVEAMATNRHRQQPPASTRRTTM
jgi:5-methylcytosine-specific restriction endonuclease McrA